MGPLWTDSRFCYDTALRVWSEWGGSNSRPREPKSRALPTALHPEVMAPLRFSLLCPAEARNEGLGGENTTYVVSPESDVPVLHVMERIMGFEPTTPALEGRCSAN